METIPMMTTLMNMMPELLAFFGILPLDCLACMYRKLQTDNDQILLDGKLGEHKMKTKKTPYLTSAQLAEALEESQKLG